MEKRTITALIVAISVALLGLVLIQAKWVSDTLILKDTQFNEGVDNALVAVSDRLERAEARLNLHTLPADVKGGDLYIDQGLADRDSSAGPDFLNKDTLNELLRGILSAGMFRDIHERIDPRLLDSLITEELRLRHIHCAFEYGVFGEGGDAVLLSLSDAADSNLVRSSPHRTRLFRNDWPQERSAGCLLYTSDAADE